jgi:hypothetical protein
LRRLEAMTYKGIVEHTQAVGGVTGLAQLTEAVKRSSLDVDAVYWDCYDCYPGGLFIHIRAWRGYNQDTVGYDRKPLLSVVISRLQPVTDDEA